MMVQVIQASSVLLLAALGALIAERAGVLNIGIEGMIAAGTFVGIAGVLLGLSPAVALVATIVAGALLAGLFALFHLRLGANPFIIGLAINVLVAGVLPLASSVLLGTRGAVRLDQPTFGPSVVVTAAVVAVAVAEVVLRTTRFGLRLTIAGQEPEWLRVNAIAVGPYRATALVVSGVLAGLAGGLLALRLGAYVPGLAAGRGWIALVLLYLGYRRPLGLVIAAPFFGLVDALATSAQGAIGVSPTLLLALPYVLTVIAFVSYSAITRRQAHRRRAE